HATAALLPPLTTEEAIQTSKIYSVAGKGGLSGGLIRQRPFRSPHYSASVPALIGGGSDNIIPGEISLAHNGVLFLDEFCEVPKRVMESLRGPMEDKKVTVSRLRTKVEYPADFMLIAATNPCPCGYFGDGDRCTCTPGRRAAYLSRLSGPIMDRIDIHLWLHPVDASALVRRRKAETSAQIADRVARARKIQVARLSGSGVFTNAAMTRQQMDAFCRLSPECAKFLEGTVKTAGLSARAYHRILKIARTIADLDAAADPSLWDGTGNLIAGAEVPDITLPNLSEAVGYRFLDKKNLII
ncbi:MAG: ATP-binding protein, partial [Bacteroidales bacterium]|nr:ATP-binding protein [Bacteroidales bacterium]